MSIDLSAEQTREVAQLVNALLDLATATAPERPDLERALSTTRGWALEPTASPTRDDDTVSMKESPGTMPDVIRGKGGHGAPTEARALSSFVQCRRCRCDIDLAGRGSTICRNVVAGKRCGATVYGMRDGIDQAHRNMLFHRQQWLEATELLIADIASALPIMGSAKIRAERDPKNHGPRKCETEICPDEAVPGRSFCGPCLDYREGHPEIGFVPPETIEERLKKRRQRKTSKGDRISGPEIQEPVTAWVAS